MGCPIGKWKHGLPKTCGASPSDRFILIATPTMDPGKFDSCFFLSLRFLSTRRPLSSASQICWVTGKFYRKTAVLRCFGAMSGRFLLYPTPLSLGKLSFSLSPSEGPGASPFFIRDIVLFGRGALRRAPFAGRDHLVEALKLAAFSSSFLLFFFGLRSFASWVHGEKTRWKSRDSSMGDSWATSSFEQQTRSFFFFLVFFVKDATVRGLIQAALCFSCA